jgi:hypothetical protein
MSDKTDKQGINKATDEAGLSFNVNTVKADMRKYYRDHDLCLKKIQGEDKKVVYEIPQFSQADVAVAALLQYICGVLVEEALKHVKKDKSHLRRIAPTHLYQAIQMNSELKTRFLVDLKHFAEETDVSYENNVPINDKELNAFVEKDFGKHVMLTPKAKNALYYFLLRTYVTTLTTSFYLLKFSGRGSLRPSAILTSVDIHFSDKIAKKAYNFVSECCQLQQTEDDKGDEYDDDPSVADEDEDEEQETKKGKGRKGKAKAAKDDEVTEDEDEEDEEDGSDEEATDEDDSDNGSDEDDKDEDEEQETKKGKGKGKAATKGKAVAKGKGTTKDKPAAASKGKGTTKSAAKGTTKGKATGGKGKGKVTAKSR